MSKAVKAQTATAPFEIRTTDLRDVRDLAKRVISGIESKTLDPSAAGKLISAGNMIRGAISTDLRVRLASTRLVEVESRTIAAG